MWHIDTPASWWTCSRPLTIRSELSRCYPRLPYLRQQRSKTVWLHNRSTGQSNGREVSHAMRHWFSILSAMNVALLASTVGQDVVDTPVTTMQIHCPGRISRIRMNQHRSCQQVNGNSDLHQYNSILFEHR